MKHSLFKVCALPSTSNYTTWSLHPDFPAWNLHTLSILIISVSSSNIRVFYFCIFSNKLDLFDAICFIVLYLTFSTVNCKNEDIYN
jgi:hypothetical protein